MKRREFIAGLGGAVLAPWIARGDCVSCRQHDELFAMACEEWARGDEECTGMPLDRREGRF
jgi:hypothetical protein